MQKIQNESNLDASLHIKFQIASMYPSKIHHLSHVITNIKYKIFPKALLIISYKGNVHKKRHIHLSLNGSQCHHLLILANKQSL